MLALGLKMVTFPMLATSSYRASYASPNCLIIGRAQGREFPTATPLAALKPQTLHINTMYAHFT